MVCGLARAAGAKRRLRERGEAGLQPRGSLERARRPPAPSRAAGTSSCCSKDRRRCPNRACCSSTTRSVSMRRFGRPARAPRSTWSGPRARGAAISTGVSQSYTAAAKAVGGLLLPAGDAWRAAWAIDPTLALYGPDGLHPSTIGHATSRRWSIYPADFQRGRETDADLAGRVRKRKPACLAPSGGGNRRSRRSLKCRASRATKPVILCRLSLAPRPPSAVTRSIYLGTLGGDSCRRDAEHGDLPLRG